MSSRGPVPVSGPGRPRNLLLAFVAGILGMMLSAGGVVGQSPPPAIGSAAPPLPGATATPAVAATPAVPRVRSLAEQEVFGFLPYWELATARDAIDLDRLTTLAWFGVEAGRNGRLIWKPGWQRAAGCRGWRDERWRSLMADAQAAGRARGAHRRALLVAVGRAQPDRPAAAQQGRAQPACPPDPQRAHREWRGRRQPRLRAAAREARDQFTLFVRELRRVLERATTEAGLPSMQITFDITAGVDAYDIPALTADDAADAVFLMAYDFRNGSAEYAASHSPLDDPESGFDIRTTVEALLRVADPAHTILGLPWYGRAWTTRGPGALLADARRGPPDAAIDLVVPRRGPHRAAPTAATTTPSRRPPGPRTCVKGPCDTCPEAWRQVWYDDVDGFGAKVRVRAGAGHARRRHVGARLHRQPAGACGTSSASPSGDSRDTVAPDGDRGARRGCVRHGAGPAHRHG